MVWPPITRDDLKNAAKRSGFDQTLPVLIRRLIAETSDGLTELDMPGESGVAAGGFDGITSATATSVFVPDGTSVWELSVGGNDAKADDDFNKRTEGPPGRQAQIARTSRSSSRLGPSRASGRRQKASFTGGARFARTT